MPYAYVLKTGSLKEFLEKVRTKDLGVPEKVTQEEDRNSMHTPTVQMLYPQGEH